MSSTATSPTTNISVKRERSSDNIENEPSSSNSKKTKVESEIASAATCNKTELCLIDATISGQCELHCIVHYVELKSYKNGQFMKIDLRDAADPKASNHPANKVMANVWRSENIAIHQPKLSKGRVIRIVNPEIKPSNKQFNKTVNDYELAFDSNTVITFLDDKGDVSPEPVPSLTIQDLTSSVEVGDTIDEMIVHILQVMPPSIINSGKAAGKSKMTIIVGDHTLHSVELTLWGENYAQMGLLEKQILYLKKLKVSNFRTCTLSLNGTLEIITPSDENQFLKIAPAYFQWKQHSGQFQSTSITTYTPLSKDNRGGGGGVGSSSSSSTAEVKRVHTSELRAIMEQARVFVDEASGDPSNTLTDDDRSRVLKNIEERFCNTNTLYTVRSSLYDLGMDEKSKILYPNCASAGCKNKRVKYITGQWQCDNCNTTMDQCNYSWMLFNVYLQDHTGLLPVKIFDNEVRTLLRCSTATANTTINENDTSHKKCEYQDGRRVLEFITMCKQRQPTLDKSVFLEYDAHSTFNPSVVQYVTDLVVDQEFVFTMRIKPNWYEGMEFTICNVQPIDYEKEISMVLKQNNKMSL